MAQEKSLEIKTELPLQMQRSVTQYFIKNQENHLLSN